MHLVGIGFTHDDWESLVQAIRRHILSETLTGTLLRSDDVGNAGVEVLGNQLAEIDADAVFFNLQAFETPADWKHFLTRSQELNQHHLRWIMIVENEREELSMFVQIAPEVELVNGMRFPINHPGILLDYHIRSFPRIRLDTYVETLEFGSSKQGSIRCRISEMKPNTLIPFDDLLLVKTEQGDMEPAEWLRDFLASRPNKVLPELVKGILREPRGCYLFPGVSFNSINRIYIDGACIHHVLRREKINLNNVPFKRFIEELRNDHRENVKIPEEILRMRQAFPICCLGEIPVINSLLRVLLGELGFMKIKETKQVKPGVHELKKDVFGLQLTKFSGTKLKGRMLDWSEDIRSLLRPLQRLIDPMKLEPEDTIIGRPFDLENLGHHCLEQLRREKDFQKKFRLASNRLLFLTQERKLLEHAENISEVINESIENAAEWSEVEENPKVFREDSALLLNDEQFAAAELAREMDQVQRKWWINPDDFKKPENLRRLQKERLQRFIEQGITVTTENAEEHFLELNATIAKSLKVTLEQIEEQNEVIRSMEKMLKEISTYKIQLALHWLYVSLKKLILKDLERLPVGALEI